MRVFGDGRQFTNGEKIKIRCLTLPTYDQQRFTVGKVYDGFIGGGMGDSDPKGAWTEDLYAVIKPDDTGETICIGTLKCEYIKCFEFAGEGVGSTAAYDRAMRVI